MDTNLTDDELAKIWQDARVAFNPSLPDYVDLVYHCVLEKTAHALRMRDLRERVDLEIQSQIW